MWPAFFVVHLSWRIIGLNRKYLITFTKLSILEGNKRFQIVYEGVYLEVEREIWGLENFDY